MEIVTNPKTLLFATTVTVLAALVCIAFLVWTNAASRTLLWPGAPCSRLQFCFLRKYFLNCKDLTREP
jgi:hypothetical protein